jgi:hypothetical protein
MLTENTILANEPDTTFTSGMSIPEPHTYVAVERYRNAEAERAFLETPYVPRR